MHPEIPRLKIEGSSSLTREVKKGIGIIEMTFKKGSFD
jgi:hypothetical protein